MPVLLTDGDVASLKGVDLCALQGVCMRRHDDAQLVIVSTWAAGGGQGGAAAATTTTAATANAPAMMGTPTPPDGGTTSSASNTATTAAAAAAGGGPLAAGISGGGSNIPTSLATASSAVVGTIAAMQNHRQGAATLNYKIETAKITVGSATGGSSGGGSGGGPASSDGLAAGGSHHNSGNPLGGGADFSTSLSFRNTPMIPNSQQQQQQQHHQGGEGGGGGAGKSFIGTSPGKREAKQQQQQPPQQQQQQQQTATAAESAGAGEAASIMAAATGGRTGGGSVITYLPGGGSSFSAGTSSQQQQQLPPTFASETVAYAYQRAHHHRQTLLIAGAGNTTNDKKAVVVGSIASALIDAVTGVRVPPLCSSHSTQNGSSPTTNPGHRRHNSDNKNSSPVLADLLYRTPAVLLTKVGSLSLRPTTVLKCLLLVLPTTTADRNHGNNGTAPVLCFPSAARTALDCAVATMIRCGRAHLAAKEGAIIGTTTTAAGGADDEEVDMARISTPPAAELATATTGPVVVDVVGALFVTNHNIRYLPPSTATNAASTTTGAQNGAVGDAVEEDLPPTLAALEAACGAPGGPVDAFMDLLIDRRLVASTDTNDSNDIDKGHSEEEGGAQQQERQDATAGGGGAGGAANTAAATLSFPLITKLALEPPKPERGAAKQQQQLQRSRGAPAAPGSDTATTTGASPPHPLPGVVVSAAQVPIQVAKAVAATRCDMVIVPYDTPRAVIDALAGLPKALVFIAPF